MNIHVYEMRHLSAEVRERFQSDMRIVVDYLAEGNNYRSDRKVVHKEALIRILMALNGETNVEDTEKIISEINLQEGDEITVCELFDQYMRKGKALGDAARLVKCIDNAIKNFHLTLEEACEGLGTTVNSYEEAKKLIS